MMPTNAADPWENSVIPPSSRTGNMVLIYRIIGK